MSSASAGIEGFLGLLVVVAIVVFLPVLLFYGAYNLNASDLRASFLPVTLLAVPGVIVTVGLVGATLHVATGLSWQEALLFGTIVSATDPVAVLAIFGELGAPRRLSAIVTGESLFNDGTALVFFSMMLTIVTSSTIDSGRTAEHFILDILGSLVLGIAVGIVGSTALHRVDDALLETTMTLIMAYGGYLAASHLGISGPLETVAAGIVLSVRSLDVMSPTTRLQAEATWEFLDFLANSLLFVLMGLALRPVGELTTHRVGIGVWWPLIVSIVAVVVARPLVVMTTQAVLTRLDRRLPEGWPTVITWSGLRGAVSIAAALSLPSSVPHHDLLLALTFGVVMFTLVAQGLTMAPLLERSGLDADPISHHDVELLVGRLRMLEAASREIDALRESEELDGRLADRLRGQYQDQRHALRKQLEAAYHSSDAFEREQEHEVRRRLLRIQHDAVGSALAQGRISHSVFRELIAETDRQLAQLEASPRTDA